MDILTIYIIHIILAVVGLPAGYAGAKHWWEKTHYMQRIIKQKPSEQSFRKLYEDWKSYTHLGKDGDEDSAQYDKGYLFENRINNAKSRDPIAAEQKIYDFIEANSKYFTYRFIYKVLIGISFLLLLVTPLFSWLPLFLLPLAIFGLISIRRAIRIYQIRLPIIMKMYQVAAAEFKYPKGGELVPWTYISVKQWDDETTPGGTIIMYPTGFRADDVSRRESFESLFNATVTKDNTWIYNWDPSQSAVLAEPADHITEFAAYPPHGSSNFDWYTFPIGEGKDGIVSYSVSKNREGEYYPHVLIAGTTGSGKSVIQRNILFHCIQHNDKWRFLGVDVKRVEITPFNKYKKTVMGIAANLEDGVEICRFAKDTMMERYEEMEEAGVNHFLSLKNDKGEPPFAILLMIDEAYAFLSPEGIRSDEGKRRDELHAEAATLIGDIARLGRAAGIHLVLATQRPDATVIKGELKANLDVRIAAGRLDSTPSLMVLDSNAATMLPGRIKGRGVIRKGGQVEQFQGYFAEADWIDTWLEDNPEREPSLFEGRPAKKSLSRRNRRLPFSKDDFLKEDIIEGDELFSRINDYHLDEGLFAAESPKIIDGLDDYLPSKTKEPAYGSNPMIDLLPPTVSKKDSEDISPVVPELEQAVDSQDKGYESSGNDLAFVDDTQDKDSAIEPISPIQPIDNLDK